MIRLGIKEFQKKYPKVLEVLSQEEIELTRRGKIIAVIKRYEEDKRPTTGS